MRFSRLAWGAALALLFLVALLALAPARLLGLVLPPDQVALQGFGGTVWNGRASRCMLRLPPGYLHLGAVNWRLQPLSLLTLSPRIRFDSAWGDQVLRGEVRLRGPRSLDLENFEGAVAADLVRQFAPVAIDGRLSMQLAQLSVRDALPYSARGRVVWQDGGFLSPRGRVPLGTYALELRQEPGETLFADVVTVAGSLQAQGRVELEGRAYRLDLALAGDGALDPQLEQALALMAVPEGDSYRIELEGTF